MRAPAQNLTKRQLLQLSLVMVLVLFLLLDNIKIQPLEHLLQPVFNRTIYPTGLRQRWNMFVGQQTNTLALRVQSVHDGGEVSYTYSNMGQKPYLWPNKQRNIEWGLAVADYSGQYRLSYLKYICNRDSSLVRVIYQSAYLPLPTAENPDYDPFIDTPDFMNLTSVECK